jgi:hypothetical protein
MTDNPSKVNFLLTAWNIQLPIVNHKLQECSQSFSKLNIASVFFYLILSIDIAFEPFVGNTFGTN